MRQLDMAVNLDAGVRFGNVGAKNYELHYCNAPADQLF